MLEIFGDYGLDATILFLIGLGLGIVVFLIFYLVLILKTNDEKQIVKPEHEVTKDEIVSIIKKSHARIEGYSKEHSMEFNKTKEVTGSLMNASKDMIFEIANAFYPSSSQSLMQLTIDEVLMTNREIIKDAKFIINNLDESVVRDINQIIVHANNVTSKFGYNLTGSLTLKDITIGDLTNIKSYMQERINIKKIETTDKEGILKNVATVVKNRGFIKEEAGYISEICLNNGIDISAELKKIGGALRDELTEDSDGSVLKAVGSALKSAVTSKPKNSIANIKDTVLASTKKVILLSSDEILSRQLASVYKDIVTMIGIEVYAIYSKQLFMGKSINKIELQQLLDTDKELSTEVNLTLKKQLSIS